MTAIQTRPFLSPYANEMTGKRNAQSTMEMRSERLHFVVERAMEKLAR